MEDVTEYNEGRCCRPIDKSSAIVIGVFDGIVLTGGTILSFCDAPFKVMGYTGLACSGLFTVFLAGSLAYKCIYEGGCNASADQAPLLPVSNNSVNNDTSNRETICQTAGRYLSNLWSVANPPDSELVNANDLSHSYPPGSNTPDL